MMHKDGQWSIFCFAAHAADSLTSSWEYLSDYSCIEAHLLFNCSEFFPPRPYTYIFKYHTTLLLYLNDANAVRFISLQFFLSVVFSSVSLCAMRKAKQSPLFVRRMTAETTMFTECRNSASDMHEHVSKDENNNCFSTFLLCAFASQYVFF